MIKTLYNEARELLIKTYEKTGNAKEVAKYFGVDTSTVYLLYRQKKATGSVKLRTNKRGRKPSLSSEDLSNIDKAIQEQLDITIDEIIEKFDFHVTNEIIRKAVIKMGYVYKKNLFMLLNENIPDVRKKEKIGLKISPIMIKKKWYL